MGARRAAIVAGFWLLWAAAWRMAIPFEIAPRISVWWLPAGLTFAFLVVFGLRYLPAVIPPQLAIAALVLPGQPVVWFVLAAVVSLGYGAAAGVIRRVGGPHLLTTVKGVCIFFLAATVGTAAVALLGSLTLGSIEAGSWGNLRSMALGWWVGDLAAIAILAPFLVVFTEPLRAWAEGNASPQPSLPAALGDVRTIAALAGLTLLAVGAAFLGVVTTGYIWYYVLLLPTMWAAYKLGVWGGAATTLVVAVFLLTLLHWYAPVSTPVGLQFFMIAASIATLLFAAVVKDWRDTRGKLLDERARLEDRVEKRTAELAEANALLQMEIHTRETTEAALIEAKELAEERYRELEAIYRQAPVGLALLDRDLRILRVNEALAGMNGVTHGDETDRSLADVLSHAAPEILAHARRVIDTGVPVAGVEVRVETSSQSGVERFWLFDEYPLKGPDGAVTAVSIVAREITERKAADKALLQAKEAAERANALKSRFLAATSHDLRQPLQTMALLQSILAERVKDEEAGRIIRQLGVAVDVMTDTLNTLLDIDGLESGRLEARFREFPVQSLFDRMRSEFLAQAREKGLELRVVETKTTVRSDPLLLERLVQNYVSNAVKYTLSGKVLIGCRRRGEALRIAVWDTGPGIPEDEQALVFDEFYRGKESGGGRERGLGLGLALVRGLAGILGHRVGLHSVVGKGSMFFVELPLGRSRHGVVSARLPSRTGRPREPVRVILLIEDDPAVCESLGMLLEGNGYRVSSAFTGEEAVGLVEEGGTLPALIIADHNLPGAMTGVEAAQRIRSAQGKVPVPGLILTGEASREKLQRYTELGLSWIQKPVKAEDLLARVRRLIEETAVAEEARPPTPTSVLSRAGAEPEAADHGANVLIVEDDEGLRHAMSMVLEAEGFQPKAFANAADFLAAFGAERNGCILIDIGLPGMNGLQLQQRLNTDGVEMPVVIISARGEIPLAVQAMRAGAVDFLQKPVKDRMLIDAVNRALHTAREAAAADQEREKTEARLERLTPREREVLTMVATGLANKEIAARLKISQRTVENHRAHVMSKMQARSLADLVRAVAAAGIPSQV